MSSKVEQLRAQLNERILVLDGGMGTMIQSYRLNEADFRGERFADWPCDLKGNNDLLVLSKPEVIAAIHNAYFEAGADSLVVNPYSLAGDATYTGYEISSNGSTGHQQVAFLYTHPDYPDGLAVAISLNGGDLTAADIEIVGGPNSAAA